MKTTFPVQDVLAVAFAAYRKNGGYVKVAQRFSETNNQTIHANKDLVKYHFQDAANWLPSDYNKLEVTEADYDAVDVALKHFRRYTLGVIGGQLTGFQEDVFKVVSGDTVDFQKVGLLAYVPELVRREVEDAAFKKLLRTEYRDSQYIGKEKDNVEGVAKILSRFFSEQWQSYNYVADLTGNLVSFMTKDRLEVGERKRIKAKIRSQVKNRSFDVNETRLNYVKLFKV
jgi:hypothetical protein